MVELQVLLCAVLAATLLEMLRVLLDTCGR